MTIQRKLSLLSSLVFGVTFASVATIAFVLYYNHLCLYMSNPENFVIGSQTEKQKLSEHIYPILWILIVCFAIGMCAIILLSHYISKVAYSRFRKIIKQIQEITTQNLDTYIESPNTGDELQELVETFNNLLAKIKETMTVQGSFISYISHEFKTPLTILLGNLEVLLLTDRTKKEYIQMSQQLVPQIKYLAEILDTLMLVFDLKKKSSSNNQSRIDEVIWQIVEQLQQIYFHCNIQVKLRVDSHNQNLLLISIEYMPLFMILFNLIENAVKYSQGKPVEIVVFCYNNQLCLKIIDQGVGIMQKDFSNIFKPFYRSNQNKSIEGLGIGLSIAFRLMEKFHIRYDISSEQKKGTVVTLNF